MRGFPTIRVPLIPPILYNRYDRSVQIGPLVFGSRHIYRSKTQGHTYGTEPTPYIEFTGTLQNSGFWLVEVSGQNLLVKGAWVPQDNAPLLVLPELLGSSNKRLQVQLHALTLPPQVS